MSSASQHCNQISRGNQTRRCKGVTGQLRRGPRRARREPNVYEFSAGFELGGEDAQRTTASLAALYETGRNKTGWDGTERDGLLPPPRI